MEGENSYRLAYFDTNVFDPDHGLREAEEPLILEYLRSGRFRLIFDLDCFLEPLLVFKGSDRDTTSRTQRQLNRMLKWCDLRRIVRPPQSLLNEAVIAYSVGRSRRLEFLARGELDPELEKELKDWNSIRSQSSKFWQSLASDAQKERDAYHDTFTNLLSELGPRDGFAAGGTVPTFDTFWEDHKYRVAETLVESVGHAVNRDHLWRDCSDRGVDGLLDIRCIRLAVSATTSLMYSHFYNEGRQIPKIKQSDAADVRHVIAASAAEIS